MYKKDIKINELKTGNILLCSGNTFLISDEIKKSTNSNYTHAAIYLGNQRIAHSTMKSGVNIISIQELIKKNNYIGVLRLNNVWSKRREEELLKFVSKSMTLLITNYNFSGLYKFNAKKIKHDINSQNKLEQYFKILNRPKPKSFFCSQFILECLYAIDYLDDSVLVAYDPNTSSPSDLIHNNLCGLFYGFINPNNFNINKNDELFHKDKYIKIFGL